MGSAQNETPRTWLESDSKDGKESEGLAQRRVSPLYVALMRKTIAATVGGGLEWWVVRKREVREIARSKYPGASGPRGLIADRPSPLRSCSRLTRRRVSTLLTARAQGTFQRRHFWSPVSDSFAGRSLFYAGLSSAASEADFGAEQPKDACSRFKITW